MPKMTIEIDMDTEQDAVKMYCNTLTMYCSLSSMQQVFVDWVSHGLSSNEAMKRLQRLYQEGIEWETM